MVIFEVDVEFDARDAGFFRALRMQVIAIELELLEFILEFLKIDAQVQERADEHVPGNAADEVEIKGAHCK